MGHEDDCFPSSNAKNRNVWSCKRDRTDISNYRPISILTPFLNILEKVTYNRLPQRLNIKNILVKGQFGLSENLTTEKVTYELNNEIAYVHNEKITSRQELLQSK
jgi:hypothetical protein